MILKMVITTSYLHTLGYKVVLSYCWKHLHYVYDPT